MTFGKVYKRNSSTELPKVFENLTCASEVRKEEHSYKAKG